MNQDELLRQLWPLYRTYHKNQHGFIDPAHTDESRRPDDWPRGEYRTYERGETVTPPEGFDRMADDAVVSALHDRASFTEPKASRPISKGELFGILAAAYSVKDNAETRPVPSAGQKYPLELYPLVIDATDMDTGLYHYNPGRNVLERPADPGYIAEEYEPFESFIVDNWAHLEDDHAISVMILITGIPSRATQKYGERGYMFTLIEVGAVIQALQLAAGRFDVGSRPYAGFQYNDVADLLGLVDHSREWVLTSVALAGMESSNSSV